MNILNSSFTQSIEISRCFLQKKQKTNENNFANSSHQNEQNIKINYVIFFLTIEFNQKNVEKISFHKR